MSVLSKSKKVMKGLKSKAVITAFGFLCLALLIWFGGPLLAIAGYEPLVSSTARLVILLLFAIIWGAINLTYRVKDKKDNEKISTKERLSPVILSQKSEKFKFGGAVFFLNLAVGINSNT